MGDIVERAIQGLAVIADLWYTVYWCTIDDSSLQEGEMVEKLPPKRYIGATEVRGKLGRLLNRVHRREEHLVVEKLGIPVAAIISMEDYEHYQRLLVQERHRKLGKKLGEAAKRQGLTEEQLIAEMEEDRRAVYKEMYGF